MSAPWTRYWQSLSPALQRYYCSSLLPCLVFQVLVVFYLVNIPRFLP